MVGILACSGQRSSCTTLRGDQPSVHAADTPVLYPTTVDLRAVESERATRHPDSPQRILGLMAFLANTNLVESLDDGGGYDSVVPLRQRQPGTSSGGSRRMGRSASPPWAASSALTRRPRCAATCSPAPADHRRRRSHDHADRWPRHRTSPDCSPSTAAPTSRCITCRTTHPARGSSTRRTSAETGRRRSRLHHARLRLPPGDGRGARRGTRRRGTRRAPGCRPSSTAVPEPIASTAPGTRCGPHRRAVVMADAYAPGSTATVNGHVETLLRVATPPAPSPSRPVARTSPSPTDARFRRRARPQRSTSTLLGVGGRAGVVRSTTLGGRDRARIRRAARDARRRARPGRRAGAQRHRGTVGRCPETDPAAEHRHRPATIPTPCCARSCLAGCSSASASRPSSSEPRCWPVRSSAITTCRRGTQPRRPRRRCDERRADDPPRRARLPRGAPMA